ncbi:MAG TPA: M23 family metallopeptidase [Flavobacteriales bacterium]|nr:M23 family metallopeptidase [Flavobacteriales bacterium]
MRCFKVLVLVLGLVYDLAAQPFPSYPRNYFRSPVDSKIQLAGTFGELRSYHFHMGLDIKAHEGTPVKAAADGYLFRAKISESGYGHVLYLNHPNGYTTVYAHLSRFTDTLEKFMHAEQYKIQSEEIDLCLPDTAFVFKKGDIIAWSGNTGHSAGPHLHFEIRDTKTEDAINPLLFGIKVSDKIKPTIQGLKIYPITETSSVDGKNTAKYYSLKNTKSSAYKKNIIVKAWGEIAFAVQAHDLLEESSRCGIYEIFVYNEKKEKIFGQRIARVGFDVSRDINVYKDYSEFHDHSRHLHKTHIKGNNRLKVYTEKDKNGIIKINGKDTTRYYIKAFDVAGNMDSVCITVIPVKTVIVPPKKTECATPVEWANPFSYKSTGIDVEIPQGTLYNDACFHYWSKPRNEKTYSRIHAIWGNGEPLAGGFDLLIEPDTLIDSSLITKILIVRTSDFKSVNPYTTACITDSVDGRKIKFGTQPKSFGTFCLMADTVGPKIKPTGFKDSMQVSRISKEIAFEIKDELAGLKTTKIFINGCWVLGHFNLKKEKLFLLPHEINLSKGYYPIKIEAVDFKDNVTILEKTVYWMGS